MSSDAVQSAASRGKTAALAELLAGGAQCMAADEATGSLPLHWAARGAHAACAELLLQRAPAAAHARNLAGNTPLHFATVAGTRRVAQLLVEHGAEINGLNKAGQTPLHGAVGQNWDHVVEYLGSLRDDTCRDCKKKKCSKHMVDVNAQDANGRTPLHYASHLFGSQVYKLLLSLGADPTIKDDNGELPKSPTEKYKEIFAENAPVMAAVLVAIFAYIYYIYKDKLSWNSLGQLF